MTFDISVITEEELRRDLKEIQDDIAACEAGLAWGVTVSRSGRSVKARLGTNRHIVEMITAELIRREK